MNIWDEETKYLDSFIRSVSPPHLEVYEKYDVMSREESSFCLLGCA